MAQVIRPQPQQGDLNQLLSVGGAIAGGVVGGLPGAAAGAGIGQMAGGLLNPAQGPAPSAGGGDSEAAAMARRQQQQSQDNLATLKQAEATLPSLPESLRQQYAPAIVQARMLEQQRMGG